MSAPLDSILWPESAAERALLELARAARLRPREPRRPDLASASPEVRGVEDRLEAAAAESDLEVETASAPYAEIEAMLAAAGPALVELDTVGGETRLAALLEKRGSRFVLLAPDGARLSVPVARLVERFRARTEAELAPALEAVLDAAGVSSRGRERARGVLLSEHLGAQASARVFLLRLPPGRPLLEQARAARLSSRLAGILAASFLASALGLASWIALGRGVLLGSFEDAWIAAWVLALASAMPLRWVEGYLQADFALRLGALLRRRLLAGAARLDPEAVRGEGSGALLGRVLESEALEALALGGGFSLLGGAIDLVLAAWAIAHAPQGALGLLLIAAAAAVAGLLALRQSRAARDLAASRRSLAQDLVERMLGHRTRIAQEPPEHWHAEEDRRLAHYLERSRRADRSTFELSACVAPCFALLSIAALGFGYVSGTSAPAALAIGIGSVLLGQQAIARLAAGLVQLATCTAAWGQVAPLYAAAAKPEESGLPSGALRRDAPQGTTPALEFRGVSFRHPSRARPALDRVDARIARGERVLVLGSSGGGKSTLASLVAGWRAAGAGTLLLEGLDRAAWGASGWRARVAAAPQFHENRVFTASLAFNLLLASKGTEGDPEEESRAESVCRDLGLGDLLDRMPSGLRQLVGETGWQLSHGERSRIYLARALLSGADLLVLDESLSGLDPLSAKRVLGVLERRSGSLIVTAHP